VLCIVYFSLNIWGIVNTKVISLKNILNVFNFILNALNFIHNAWKKHININFLKAGFRKEGQNCLLFYYILVMLGDNDNATYYWQ